MIFHPIQLHSMQYPNWLYADHRSQPVGEARQARGSSTYVETAAYPVGCSKPVKWLRRHLAGFAEGGKLHGVVSIKILNAPRTQAKPRLCS
jgi:hypothetical protein